MLSPVPILDSAILWIITPLAFVFLFGGLDDVAIDIAWLCAWVKQQWTAHKRAAIRKAVPASDAPRLVAIFVPLWQEHAVIANMLEHNLAAIRYPRYHLFAGAYPNDEPTLAAVRTVAERFPNVHLAVCPHAGPTSKADCLNWIYQHLGLYEEHSGEKFDVVVTHDAEDIVHPEELRWINHYAARYDFIQIPELARPTPFHAITHGVYCDEFAENHTRDMVVPSRYGCFVPGAGVGTGYRRQALEKLAHAAANAIFEPTALTEDYVNGLQLHRLVCSQVFLPPERIPGEGCNFVATREYFPQTWHTALRQRTRWVTGISLQGWERFGWSGSWSEVYWLWRDRKGLIGSPLGVVANAIFAYGVATALWTRLTPLASVLTSATLCLQILRMAVRMACVGRVYGFAFCLGVPVRAVYANALNATATLYAVTQFASAKLHHRPLRWMKTEHSYPTRAALLTQKRRLGEILVGSGYLTAIALRRALSTRPAGVRLGEHLLRTNELNEQALYEALSVQQGLPLTPLHADKIASRTARLLPAAVARQWRVLPFRISDAGLHLAGPELPTAAMTQALRAHTTLELHFHLLTPSAYEELTDALL